MRKNCRSALWLCWLVLAGALPAYANNAPAPDGMLSIVLIFPVVILGFRFAGAELNEKETRWRILRGVFLAICALATAIGTGIAAVALLVLLGYGLLRGVQIMWRGQGRRRFALGPLVIVFTLVACANYLASLGTWSSVERSEASAVSAVRNIITAEITYVADKRLDANQNGISEYGTLEQLREAGLIPDFYLAPEGPGGYRLSVVLRRELTGDEKEFFAYAAPGHYGRPARVGISLLKAFLLHRYYGVRTFAADESGEIRGADLGGARAVTREEAQKWAKLN